ncbi:VrrA/YqfQ family protein [Virgibacillus sp. DJP39]|uniref:VrrA/YqfQ family protein n=1 Tax=Virgibacillus sp. DJP39 TaxID=3409790 RepID=UPI003BB4F3CD
MNNRRPPVPQRPMNYPYNVGPNRLPGRYPGPKPKTSLPSTIATFLNPESGGLTKTLSKVQQVMNMAETAGPMIKEYGPMVKNLPSMLKMLKALRETDDSEADTHTSTMAKQLREPDKAVQTSKSAKKTTGVNDAGTSKPKLFI